MAVPPSVKAPLWLLIQPVLSEVRHISIRPAVVVIIPDGRPKAPLVVSHTGLFRHIGKGSVMIVMEECCMGGVVLPVMAS
jgi:hypothetical protein